MHKIYSLVIVLLSFSFLNLQSQDIIPSQWHNLKGYWKFQNSSNLTKATVGNNLILKGSHQWVAGPSKYDTAIRIGVGSYYRCNHNIAPNGGGDSVNQYTLMFDFKILSLKKWHTFFQTDTTNTNDGECFIRPLTSSNPGRIGTATTGYTSDSVTPNKWYRLVISVNLGSYYRYYLNGKLILEGDTQDIDDRFSLNPHFLLFADNDQEDDTIDIASVAVFDTCLSSADIAILGTIDPCVLHPMGLSLGRDTTICGSNTLTKNLGYGYTYLWNNNDTSSNVTFSMAKNGSGLKTIWVKKTDINSCVLRDTFKLGIYTPPTVNLGKDSNLCDGQSIKLIAGSAGGNTYIWRKLPAGYVVSKVNNLTIDSSGIFEVKMTNTNGCSALDSIQITVHALPAKPAISVSKFSLCYGDTAQVSGPAAYPYYLWNNAETTRNIKVDKDATLKLKVRTAFNCESPWSDSVTILVHAVPVAPILQYSKDTAFCMGDSTLLQTSNIYSSYNWNDGYSLPARYVKTSGVYFLSVKNVFGCKSPISNTIRTTTRQNPAKPIIEILSGKANLCPGDSVMLNCKSNSTTYLWSNSKKTKSIAILLAGKYSMLIMDTFACISPASDSIQIFTHPLAPKPIIIAKGKDSLSSLNPALTYMWIRQGQSGFLSGRTILGIDNSNYNLTVSDQWCSSPSSDTYHFEIEGIGADEELSSSLKFYPNPVSANGILSFNSKNISSIQVIIYNIHGQVMYQANNNAADLSSGIKIDMENYAPGVYIIRLVQDGIAYQMKITVQ